MKKKANCFPFRKASFEFMTNYWFSRFWDLANKRKENQNYCSSLCPVSSDHPSLRTLQKFYWRFLCTSFPITKWKNTYFTLRTTSFYHSISFNRNSRQTNQGEEIPWFLIIWIINQLYCMCTSFILTPWIDNQFLKKQKHSNLINLPNYLFI